MAEVRGVDSYSTRMFVKILCTETAARNYWSLQHNVIREKQDHQTCNNLFFKRSTLGDLLYQLGDRHQKVEDLLTYTENYLSILYNH